LEGDELQKIEGRKSTMKKLFLTMTAAGLLMGVTGIAAADDVIKDRKENQQDRIAQGVGSGSLTPKETANLEHKEANLNKEIRHDRKQNGGNLTNKEKAQVNRQQNHLSKNIYKDKSALRFPEAKYRRSGRLARSERLPFYFRNKARRDMASSRMGRSAA
jgi:hypothetical protein